MRLLSSCTESMKFHHRLLTAAAVASVAVFTPRAGALVSLEDGRDHLFIDGTVDMSYDSNVFTNALDQGSMVYEGTISTEFTRRAGWIGVNATAALDWAHYANFRGQDYADPSLKAELTKQTGRTTGSLTLGVQRIDRADVDVSTRDISWNYNAGLNFQYPVIERYSISGSFAYTRVNYLDQALFTNQTNYSGELYLYYILNEVRDLFVTYQTELTDEAKGAGNDLDRSLSIGVSGKVVGPFNGSLQAGYDVRTPEGAIGPYSVTSHDWSASGSMIWNLSRRMTLTADISREFSTTAEALSIESSTLGLTFQDSLTAKASLTLAASGGENEFLGAEGDTAPGGKQRVDTFATLSASYFYTLNKHLKAYATYTYYRNWSTLPFADFPREEISAGLSSHW
jgi:Putative beta-barrel porin 2